MCTAVFIGGSSGGNIAAAVALAVRDEKNLQNIRAQVLLNAPLQVWNKHSFV